MGVTLTSPVLIVDDDQGIRGLTARYLRFHGWASVEAEHGLAALSYLRGGGDAGAIILDLRMPVMDGWEFRREQQQDPTLRDIPVIVMSGADHDRFDELQADACFYKPVSLADVLKCVKRLASARTPTGD